MGLDQYAFARKEGEKDTEIMYWRKHADLEGWMSDLYHSRGGKADFNCVELKLEVQDLERLEREHRNLETAQGFFWGESRPEDLNATDDFLSLAYKAIEDGYDIIYTSWW
tara:strand:- start:2654 stop:2983 length:330 start_codon:yes stop_codon:yes gene_type:complete